MTYNTLKKFNNQIYSGMRIGGSHQWLYDNGKWFETKLTPDVWQFSFHSIKTLFQNAPINSGAIKLVINDQIGGVLAMIIPNRKVTKNE